MDGLLVLVAALVMCAAIAAGLAAAIGWAEREKAGPLLMIALLIALAVGLGLWERRSSPWRSVEEKCEGCAW